MSRPRAIIAVAVSLLIAWSLAACGGSEGKAKTTSPPPTQAPSGGATPPGSVGGLPPGFVECMAEKGYKVQSPQDIHSAPPAVLQACFQH
jgi:hypothetical protein